MTKSRKPRISRKEKRLSHARLLELLTYVPETGLFIRNTTQGRYKRGDVHGNIGATLGYWEIMVDGDRFYGHRLAWFYMTGEWPPVTVDHENTIRSDNRWENLRLATKGQQMMNRGKTKNNKSGAKGISWDDKNQKWCAEVRFEYRRYWLGRFDELDQAVGAADAKRAELHGEFARS